MKVQITVDEQLWRKAKVSAMLRGQSLGELVGVALGDLLKNVLLSDGLAVPDKAEHKKDGVGGQPVSRGRTGGSTPPTSAKPVVDPVPEFACKVCGKPTDGAYVCKSCADNRKNP